jgi:hypothetical protein
MILEAVVSKNVQIWHAFFGTTSGKEKMSRMHLVFCRHALILFVDKHDYGSKQTLST